MTENDKLLIGSSIQHADPGDGANTEHIPAAKLAENPVTILEGGGVIEGSQIILTINHWPNMVRPIMTTRIRSSSFERGDLISQLRCVGRGGMAPQPDETLDDTRMRAARAAVEAKDACTVTLAAT